MKADGIEYEERMALLDEVTWPQPLAELLEATYEIYRQSHPWLPEDALSPKSIVRELWEQGMTFTEFISPLPAGPVGGAAAALPDRRLPHAAADGARRAPDPGARGPGRVAGGDGAADRLVAAGRVGGADRPRARPLRRRPPRATAAAAADHGAGAGVHGDGAQRDVPPGGAGRRGRRGRADADGAAGGRPDRPAPRGRDDPVGVGRGPGGVLRRARLGRPRRRRPRSRAAGGHRGDRHRGSGGSGRPSTTPRATTTG